MYLFQHSPPTLGGGRKPVVDKGFRGSGCGWEVDDRGRLGGFVLGASRLRRQSAFTVGGASRPRWDRSQAGGGNPIPSPPDTGSSGCAPKPVECLNCWGFEAQAPERLHTSATV